MFEKIFDAQGNEIKLIQVSEDDKTLIRVADLEKAFDKDGNELTESQLNEFKADHSDSAIADPIAVGSNVRSADKTGGEKAPQSVDSDGLTLRSREGLIGRTISDLKDAPDELVKSIFDQVRDWKSNGPAKNKRPADKMNGDTAPKKLTAKEDLEVVFGDAELTEEFIDRASVLFEAAVQNRVDMVTGEIAEEYAAKLEEEIENNLNEVAEKVIDLVEYVVNVWMEQNEVEIVNALKVDVAEGMFAGLKTMFESYNIEIPAEKIDVVEEVSTELESTRAALEETTAELEELRSKVFDAEKSVVFARVSEGLATSQIDKLRKLAESIGAEDAAGYEEKLNIIKESFFKDGITSKSLQEEVDGEVSEGGIETGEITEGTVVTPMDRYVQAASRTFKK